MKNNEKNEGTKQTWTGVERLARIEAIKNEIKAKKKLPKEEVYRFALNSFGVSIRIIDEYLKELALLGLIEIVSNGDTDYKEVVVWRGNDT